MSFMSSNPSSTPTDDIDTRSGDRFVELVPKHTNCSYTLMMNAVVHYEVYVLLVQSTPLSFTGSC
jgi:hypothetical protein